MVSTTFTVVSTTFTVVSTTFTVVSAAFTVRAFLAVGIGTFCHLHDNGTIVIFNNLFEPTHQ